MTKFLLFPILLFYFSISAQTWQDVGGGLNSSSHTMCTWNGMLIDGGSFGSPCGRVAGWNGTNWICFGSGVGIVARAAVEFQGNLIVCGDFWNVNQPCTGCNGIAMWNGTTWSALGAGFNNDVLCLTVWNGYLVAGGDFTTCDGNPCSRIAKWDGTSWTPIGGITDFDNDIRAMAVYNGELWVGGDFANVGGCTACDRIVKWNGTIWVGGNSGVDIPGGLDSTVRVLYVNPSENRLYLGGHFLNVGGNVNCSRVAVYDGSVWYPLGTGVDNYVRAIHAYNGNIIVGGDFLNAGTTPANKIAKWNLSSSTWTAMGTGMNDYVKAMGVYNGEFFAGGPFTTADGLPRSCVAKWYETPALPPVAAFSAASYSLCLGLCNSYTDNSTNIPTSWNWAFAGGTPATSTAQNPTNICYNTPGVYTVTLTVCNTNGCNTTTSTITVGPNPPPTVSLNAVPSAICIGNSSNVTASGATTYAWSPSTGLSATSGAAVIASPTVTTTYTVTGTTSGCTGTNTITITVNALPVVSVTPSSTNICTGGFASLTANGASTYTWSPSTGLSATTGANVNANPSVSIIYTVTGTNSSGCTASSTVSVTVLPALSLPIIEGFQSLPFLPVNWSMVDGGNDGNTWQQNTSVGGFSSVGSCAWFSNNTVNAPGTRDGMRTMQLNFASLNTAQMTFDVAYCRRTNSSFSDTLVVYASTDCGQTWTQLYSKGGTTLSTASNQNTSFIPTISQWRTETVSLNAYVGQTNVTFLFQNRNWNGNNLYLDNVNITGVNNGPPAAAFTSNTTAICPGQCITFTDNTTGLPTSWSWAFPGGSPSTSSQQNPGSVCWNTAGTYVVTLTSCNGNGCNTATQTINVTMPVMSAGADDTICTGGNVMLVPSGGISYLWAPGGSLSCTTCPNPVATPTVTTTYTVTGTDANGCSNTDVVTITVMLCTGISMDHIEQLMKVYPNPATDNITIELNYSETAMLSVFNMIGEEVRLQYLYPGVNDIEISELPKGIYLFKVQVSNVISTQKIIVR
jgi:PKD repeat protein